MNANNTFKIEKSPLKDNIKYAVIYIRNDLSLGKIFQQFISDIKEQGESTARTIAYCQRRTQCAALWRTFMVSLSDSFYSHGRKEPINRMVEMLHAGTPNEVKQHVLSEATKVQSNLRILMCTIAFGMGIDCKGFNRIIHFGPSRNLESYVQECGRAGRDGKDRICFLVYNSLLTSRCSDDMKALFYASSCRRKIIAESFNCKTGCEVACPCCDVCVKKYECDVNKSCQEKLYLDLDSDSQHLAPTTRTISAAQMKILDMELSHYLDEYQNSIEKDILPVACPNRFLEFGIFQIEQLKSAANSLFTLEDNFNKVEM